MTDLEKTLNWIDARDNAWGTQLRTQIPNIYFPLIIFGGLSAFNPKCGMLLLFFA